MKQTRLQSLMETLAGICIGFVVSMGLSAVVYPLFGHTFSLAENAWITVIFTVASIVRSYLVRRLFNRLHSARA